jgi:putative membrane protein
VRDHEKVIAAFDKQAKSGKDAELKAYASKTLPTLRSHLQMAKQVQTGPGAAPAASR